jgi:hypothetical protein
MVHSPAAPRSSSLAALIRAAEALWAPIFWMLYCLVLMCVAAAPRFSGRRRATSVTIEQAKPTREIRAGVALHRAHAAAAAE